MFAGYLVKFGDNLDFELPLDLIDFGSFSSTYSVLDVDAKRNGKGVLVRTPLSHRVAHCTMQMRENLTNTQIGTFFTSLSNKYSDAEARKIHAKIYIQEMDDYVECDVYIPDITFMAKSINGNVIKYKAFQLELIGY